jgi:hypothetical protein
MNANLKVHVDFGYDYFYVDFSNKKIYSHSAWSGKCDNFLGKFSNEMDLKRKIAKSVGKNDDFYFNNPNKWDCNF